MELEQNRPILAREAFQRCEEIFRALSEAQPDDIDLVFETAATNSWLAKTYLVEYQLSSGLEHRILAANQYAQVAASTGYPFHKKMEAESWGLLAETHFLNGDVDIALENSSRAQLIIEELQQKDADNVEWKMRLLFHRHLHAVFDFYQQPDVPKYRLTGDTIAAAAELARADPGNQEWAEVTVQMIGNSLIAGALVGEKNAYSEYFADYPDLLSEFSLDDLVVASETQADVTLAVKIAAMAALSKEAAGLGVEQGHSSTMPDPETMRIISDLSEKPALALFYAAHGRFEESRLIMEYLAEAGYAVPQICTLVGTLIPASQECASK